jgi:hypothetical protein
MPRNPRFVAARFARDGEVWRSCLAHQRQGSTVMNSIAASPGFSTASTSAADRPRISALRLNLLRVPYAILAVGLGAYVWPDVIRHSDVFTAHHAIPTSLLAGLGAVALLGLRYPLRMLPLLVFEFAWKAIFLIAFALPLYLSHRLDPATIENAEACLVVVLLIPFMPWRYMFDTYVMGRGEAWK